jgi:hypothetical protein
VWWVLAGCLHTIWPAPTTPSFFTSNAIEGVEENWRWREASRCEATCDFDEAISLDGSRDSEAISKEMLDYNFNMIENLKMIECPRCAYAESFRGNTEIFP